LEINGLAAGFERLSNACGSARRLNFKNDPGKQLFSLKQAKQIKKGLNTLVR
jgi:hypothetical protein